MKPAPLVRLGPGSQVPEWAEALERTCFGDAWGPLEDGEYLWAAPGLGFARWRAIPAAQEAELLRVAIDPQARRGGHGRALLRACEASLAGLGIQTLHLEVRVGNGAARGLYESEGWGFQGERKDYYRDGEAAALYQKPLPG